MVGLRVTFRIALALAGLLSPVAAEAQQSARVYRVALLDYSAPDAARQGWWNAFREQMRELGYHEGRNVSFEPRWAQADNDRLSKQVAELVGVRVDVIVAGGPNAAVAAKRASSTVPIVVATGSDPVALGLVASLRQPGGNVTGLTSISSELTGKRLELLRLVMPAARVGFLWDETNPGSRLAAEEAEAAARTLGLTLKSVPVRSSTDFEAVFAALVRDRMGTLSVSTSAPLRPHRKRLAELALKHRLPSVGGDREWAEAGLLLSYGTDYPNLFRRAAMFVDKILKGTKPGDLPIEQPTKFDLSINLKTAKALGLTISPSLLQRADHVIQ